MEGVGIDKQQQQEESIPSQIADFDIERILYSWLILVKNNLQLYRSEVDVAIPEWTEHCKAAFLQQQRKVLRQFADLVQVQVATCT